MQLVQWMDAVAARPQVRPYADAAALARRLRAVNPRLTRIRPIFCPVR
jgi:hypothetical protein